MKRLGYRKSRTGCARCKVRRVKCDEKVPCAACLRHKVPCSLQLGTPDVPPRSRRQLPTSQKTQHDIPFGSSPSGHQSGLFSDFSHFRFDSSAHRPPEAPHWMLDIELAHHYTLNAHHTLYSPCRHAFTALQNDIPLVAFHHPFLMHQILAFSALHLAYLHPESRNRYLIQASQHQGVALDTMKKMLRKPLEPGSCHSLYASSLFVATSAFGTFPSCDRYNDAFRPIDSLADIFVLMHGMYTILNSSGEIIRNGPLKALLGRCSCEPSKPSCLPRLISRLKELLSFVENETATIDDKERQILVEAVAAFIEAIVKVTSTPGMNSMSDIRVIFDWPMRLSASYLAFLRQGNPFALAILSYYCVLLQSREPNHWMFAGWSDALMKPIKDRVRGSPAEELIQWPINDIEEQKAESVSEDTTDASSCGNLEL